MRESTLQKPKERTMQVFFLCLAVAAAMFLPFIIYDKGYFIFYGDFNSQQIPFYRLAHDAFRSGNVGWNWNTDLGANFIGSYTFYLIGSPFFLITLLFPSAAVPFLIAPLLVLKFALAGVTAYKFLRIFLKPYYAVLGGILYAFSGFSLYNIFFNHFHEVIIIFPLMLLGLEKLMKEKKYGFFAITVCASAFINYYFFIAQCVFLIIYWIIRAMSGAWEMSVSKVLIVLFEAVLGVTLASVLLIPSFLTVIQNSRVGETISGWDTLAYSPQRFLDILHSFFFPQDPPANGNFFPDSNNKWGSVSMWIPVFSCIGVFAYVQSRKHKDWLRKLIIVSVLFALVPVLNSTFQLFNQVYYARWFYMPLLVFILATMKSFQDQDSVPVNWKRAFGLTAGITAAFALAVGLFPTGKDPTDSNFIRKFGLYNDFFLFLAVIIFAVVSLIIAAIVIHNSEKKYKYFRSTTLVFVSLFCFASGVFYLAAGKADKEHASYLIEQGIKGEERIDIPDENFARVDFHDDSDNFGMYWKRPTIQAFHSIIPGSVMEFYKTLNITRNVRSNPDSSHYPLRGLLSIEWLFDYVDTDENFGEDKKFFNNGTAEKPDYAMDGWTYFDTQNKYDIYRNENYIPYGFTYDYYISRTDFEKNSPFNKEMILLKALVLEDDDAKEYDQFFNNHAGFPEFKFGQSAYLDDCAERAKISAHEFIVDGDNFYAKINLEKEELVFFSVPYEDGWSAKVNGVNVPILKANVGFMAVPCYAGENVSIEFSYKTPGLYHGKIISALSLLVLIIYMLISRKISGRTVPSATDTTVKSTNPIDFYFPDKNDIISLDTEKSSEFNLDEYYIQRDSTENDDET